MSQFLRARNELANFRLGFGGLKVLLNVIIKGASHQPAFMGGCLTIIHTCLPSLPSEKTLLSWSVLFVVGKELSWERCESSELGGQQRCMSVVRQQGGKGRKIVRWHFGGGGRVVRWQGRKDVRVVRQQGERLLISFKGGGCRVRPRFHLFVSDANQRNEEAGCVQDISAWPQI